MTTHPTPIPLPLPRRIAIALADIKLAHSVFALPFALLSAFLVAPRIDTGVILWGTFALQLALVVLCMVLARTWAMLVNRLADRSIDAANPRTARRAFASGTLDPRFGMLLAAGCALAFTAGAALFWPLFDNPWPGILALPVLAWIALYSFTKRFTALCHLFLGGALAASPIAAAIAVNPQTILTLSPTPEAQAILAIAGFVLLWVAGFDIPYALQDLEFDRETGLHSVPAKLGVQGALWTSRLLHGAALLMLVLALLATPRLATLTAIATALVALLLILEHAILARRGVAGLPLAFFTCNGVAAVLLGLAGILDAAHLST